MRTRAYGRALLYAPCSRAAVGPAGLTRAGSQDYFHYVPTNRTLADMTDTERRVNADALGPGPALRHPPPTPHSASSPSRPASPPPRPPARLSAAAAAASRSQPRGATLPAIRLPTISPLAISLLAMNRDRLSGTGRSRGQAGNEPTPPPTMNMHARAHQHARARYEARPGPRARSLVTLLILVAGGGGAAAAAAGNALSVTMLLPWAICAIFFTLMHWTYPADRRRSLGTPLHRDALKA